MRFRGALVLIGLAVAAPGSYALAWDPPMCTLDDGAAESSDARAPVPAAPTREEARLAYRDARQLATTDPRAALRALDVVIAFAPELRERLSLEQGELLVAVGDPRAACVAFDVARRSDEPGVAIRGEVGAVRCLLAAADRHGDAALAGLLARYPALPDVLALREEAARSHERRGELAGAAAAYMALDLEEPGSSAAATAREDLARLRVSGVPIATPAPERLVARIERLARTGPQALARTDATALHDDLTLSPELHARAALALARLDREDGRTGDALALVAEARGEAQGTTLADADALAHDLADQTAVRAEATARRSLRAITHGRPLAHVPARDLAQLATLAAQAGLRPETNDALDALGAAHDATAALRLSSAIVAAGVADDARLADLLAPATADAAIGTAARYHRARSLERLGRDAEARDELRHVVASDTSELHWYALWARQRLRAMDAPSAPPLALLAMHGDVALAALEPQHGDTATDAPAFDLEQAEEPAPPDAGPATADVEHAIALVADVAARRGGAYGPMRRALALARLGDVEAATDELFETSVLFRQARGLSVPNAGIEAVVHGLVRRAQPDSRLRGARLALSDVDRAHLASAAQLLGDPGAAGAFGAPRPSRLPRPYEPYVRAAAARYRLDPDLLFAVMRVESVYNRRIVSPAGAIGLLQIMPRTGRLIATELGRPDFTPADLLDPGTNVELAAWYLASLLARFDGRLPLAVAAYNGGPHNVRRWLASCDPEMPMDSFLERIPFVETHRYVRRVLGHYAAYKAQNGSEIAVLDTTLPRPDPDAIGF